MPERVLGIDVGGTFTDFALLEDGRLTIHKLPSTPRDPSQGILQGVHDLRLRQEALPPSSGRGAARSDVPSVSRGLSKGGEGIQYVHGSTVATNALLEGKGARTALVTTAGFEDVIEIGRQNRTDLYDLLYDRPQPLVPRELRFGVRERVEYDGRVLTDLDPREAERVVRALEDTSAEAVAVSLLFSFRNAVHERVLLEALERARRRFYLSVSSQVLPEFREYERTSTVVVNAYVGPIMERYLDNLGKALPGLRIMQSSGGSITVGLAARQPVRTILSGPAGGVVGAFYTAQQARLPDVITLDMGGTSTDVSLCPGRIKETTSSTVAGYPIGVPMIEVHTVGAGGGSIARVDQGGALVVGPQSAGADPGPACYGKGEEVTVTDANLLLGRLQPEHFLGGRMRLDVGRARWALERLARSLGGDVRATALGVVRVVNANMERAIRAISLERGYDPRQFTLLPFGGAGPLHACELAEELRIPRVLVPPHPGILSALGVAIADIVKDYSLTVMLRGGELTRERLEQGFAELEERARAELKEEGVAARRLVSQRALDVRYVGQSYELTVDYPRRQGDVLRQVAGAFHRAHQQRFGYSDPREPVEVVNLRLKMVVPMDKPQATPQEAAGADASAARLGEAPVVFRGGEAAASLYLRERLRAGNRVAGPALVLQMDSTVVVPPGWAGTVDPYGNLVLAQG